MHQFAYFVPSWDIMNENAIRNKLWEMQLYRIKTNKNSSSSRGKNKEVLVLDAVLHLVV